MKARLYYARRTITGDIVGGYRRSMWCPMYDAVGRYVVLPSSLSNLGCGHESCAKSISWALSWTGARIALARLQGPRRRHRTSDVLRAFPVRARAQCALRAV
jgi:hypothetical protein